jgi:hypothetical protein
MMQALPTEHQYVSTGSLRPFPFSEVNNVQGVSSLLIYINRVIIGCFLHVNIQLLKVHREDKKARRRNMSYDLVGYENRC